MSLILECRDLSFAHGETVILNRFQCAVEKAELVSVVGPSGTGKSTFLRLCAGLDKPRSGEIKLRGKTVASDTAFTPASQRHIGYVFQNYALFEKVNVEKNMLYGCKNKSHIDEVHRLTELMKMGDHLKKFPYQLSGGERQKVALIRSLALKPDLLFLDEPFANIDQNQTLFLLNEMKTVFQRLQITALMVTHSPSEAQEFSSRRIEFSKN